jgi:hypothetical protein
MIETRTVDGIKIECKYSELRDVMEIKPHPKNNNIHSRAQVELLGALFRIHGWRVPITVSTLTGFIIRGEGRYRAALFLGMKKVPIDLQQYDNEAEEYADLIADNQVASYSDRDTDIMLNALSEMDAMDDMAAEMLGYYAEEYADLLKKFLNKEEGGDGGDSGGDSGGDNKGHMSVTDKLLAIRSAVNLRGKSVTIDGESWDADDAMMWCIKTLKHLLNHGEEEY